MFSYYINTCIKILVLISSMWRTAALDNFETSHLDDLDSYDYSVFDDRSIHPGDEQMPETYAEIRRLNPDFEEPEDTNKPKTSPEMKAIFNALNHPPNEPRSRSRSRDNDKYYEPLGTESVRKGSRGRSVKKSAREYADYQMAMGYSDNTYHQQQVKIKKVPVVKKVYVPVPVIPKKKKKKIISIDKGFHVPGGTQVFGKFKKLKQCMKLCAAIPTCFAADYNPWLFKCYIHSNITACGPLRAHKKFIHFKKVPCEIPEAPAGAIHLGAQLFNGLEQKGIKSLQDCLKKCATAGGGIAPSITALNDDMYPQLCFGIDYDFGTHKCYFFTDRMLCPPMPMMPVTTPINLVGNPAVVNIILCPALV